MGNMPRFAGTGDASARVHPFPTPVLHKMGYSRITWGEIEDSPLEAALAHLKSRPEVHL